MELIVIASVYVLGPVMALALTLTAVFMAVSLFLAPRK